MAKYVPYHIKTEAGKELWKEINHHNGSSVWGPVGEGLMEVEAEMLGRITILLEAAWEEDRWSNWWAKEVIQMITKEFE